MRCVTSVTGSSPRAASGSRRRVGSVGLWVWPRTAHSAGLSKQFSGWVLVTHPFHPLAGQRVEILYAKRRGGTSVLVCDAGGGRTMTLPVAWTDRGPAAEEHRLCGDGLLRLHGRV